MSEQRRPYIEPSADLLTHAAQIRQLFNAYREQGFTEAQAMTLVGDILTAAALGDTQ